MTTTEMTTINGAAPDAALAPRGPAGPALITDEHRNILRAMVDRNATPAQVEMLIVVGNRYDLDPLLGHVVLISGKVFVTHKGLMHKAHTSGMLDGLETTYGKDDIGEWAESRVFRKDMSRPFVGRIYIHEYANGNPVWKSCRHGMAAKTVESFTMRRAFDVSLTSQEEMGAGESTAGYAAEQDTPVPRPAASSDGPPVCGDCGKALTKAQNDLSIRNYGEALCPPCQRKERAPEPPAPELPAEALTNETLTNDDDDTWAPSDGSSLDVWEPAFADASALMKRLPADVKKTFAADIKKTRQGISDLADLGVKELKDFAARCESWLDAQTAPDQEAQQPPIRRPSSPPPDGEHVTQEAVIAGLKALENEVQGMLDALNPARRAAILAQVEKTTQTRVLSEMTRGDLEKLRTLLQKHQAETERQLAAQETLLPVGQNAGPGHGA